MESRVSDQPAFVLHRREWQNSSYILDLFTRDFGRVAVIARGVRKSRNRALYQSFVLLTLGWSGRHELKTLTGIEGHMLPINERHYLTLIYVNDLLMQLLPKQEASEPIFLAYLELLKQATDKLEESDLREFESFLLRELGYFAEISTDTLGQPIAVDFCYRFEAGSGFSRCPSSTRNAFRGQDLLDWQQKKYELEGVLKVARTVMRQSIDASLQGRQLKSRQVYQQMKNQ